MRLYRVATAIMAMGALTSGGCADSPLILELSGPARACLGQAIGRSSSVTVVNRGSNTTQPLRLRWWLSPDALPSSDDVAVAGTDANVLVPAILPGERHEASTTALVVPLGLRLGPQYLLAVVTDAEDGSTILAHDAQPIVLDQCPTDGACTEAYDDLSAYLASPHRSTGARTVTRAPSERPVIVSDDSRVLSGRGITVGGREMTGSGARRGLLLRFAEDGAFSWGKSIHHCGDDEVTSVDTFSDGTLAVASYWTSQTGIHSELRSYSRTGQLLWILPIARCDFSDSSCYGANPMVAVDTSDDTAVVAANSPGLTVVRSDRYGNELQRRSYAEVTDAPSDIDVVRFSGSRSPVLLATFGGTILALRENLAFNWSSHVAELSFGRHRDGAPEVELCTADNLYVATAGMNFYSGEHVLYSLSPGGSQRWALRLASGERAGTAPPYAGPLGLLRADRLSLRCSEQEVPEVLFVAGDNSHQTSDPRGITLRHDGTVIDSFAGAWPNTGTFGGGAGMSISSPDLKFLSLQDGKFRLIGPSAVRWSR